MSNGNKKEVEILVETFLRVSHISTEKQEKLADSVVLLILQSFPSQLKLSNPSNLPYKDITDVVLRRKERILSDSIGNFRQKVVEAIARSYNSEHPDKHHNTKKKYVDRFMHVYDKLVEHALLAQTQREFIENSIQDSINKKLDDVQNIKTIAKQAQDTAEAAQETYKSMFANYVTILGVFTAIIVTIFGGLNIINTVTKNIGENTSVVLFLTVLLFLCLILLLYFLANIVLWITGVRDVKIHWVFGVIVAICAVAMILITPTIQ